VTMNRKPRTGFARALRRNSTDAEKRLWKHLRGRAFAGWKFRRQHPVGGYIADFACPECKLIIELDGGQHMAAHEADERRTSELNRLGYRVLRFWDHEMLANTQGVLDAIYEALNSSPQSSPQRGEEEADLNSSPLSGRG